MAEWKVSKEYSQDENFFNKCCDAVFKMEWEIFNCSSNSQSFEITAKQRGTLLNKIKIKVEFYETAKNHVSATGLSKNWSRAKEIVEDFFTNLENLT